MEKTELEKISALKLLSCLSEETRLMVYRDLNRAREERFAGKLRDLSVQDRARLPYLRAIRKEQSEQPEVEEFRKLD
jgi:hypothetical protein